MPVICPSREFVQAGGLISYGLAVVDLFRRAAIFMGKIRKGADPAAMPVEQPIIFELATNVKTAEALGLTIPPAVVLGADEVIERGRSS